MNIFLPKNQRQGFTILFAIVIVSIVVSIGISLSLIALKEFAFSNTLRESQLAYYAADSGTHCILYYISRNDTNFTTNSQNVICNGDDETYNFTAPATAIKITKDFSFPDILVPNVGFRPSPYVAKVTVKKISSPRNIEVTSQGLNRVSTVAFQTQRRQKIQIENGSVSGNPDVVITMDNSGSINSDELLCEKNAVKEFIDSPELNIGAANAHASIMTYKSYATNHNELSSDKTALKAAVDTITSSSGATSGTNMEAGAKLADRELKSARDRSDATNPDVVIIIGDGNPRTINKDDATINDANSPAIVPPDIRPTAFHNCNADTTCWPVARSKTVTAIKDLKDNPNLKVYAISVGGQVESDGFDGRPYMQSLSSGTGYYFELVSRCDLPIAFKKIGKNIIKIIE